MESRNRSLSATVIAVAGVPSLIVKKPGFGIRALSLVSAGVREVSAQIEPYTSWWDDQNQLAVAADGPLWIVLGDSTSIGIGASAPENGYVGLVVEKLRALDPTWRVINLAMSGARAADGLNRQIPALAELPRPTVLTVCIGSNDVFWEWSSSLSGDLAKLVSRLPGGADTNVKVAAAAGHSPRARLANRTLKTAAARHNHDYFNPWKERAAGSSPRLAADRFHPSDAGHHNLAVAFGRAIGV